MEQVRDGLPEELMEVSKVTELQTEEPDWLAKRISLMRTATGYAIFLVPEMVWVEAKRSVESNPATE
jgi:hypothetical protein